MGRRRVATRADFWDEAKRSGLNVEEPETEVVEVKEERDYQIDVYTCERKFMLMTKAKAVAKELRGPDAVKTQAGERLALRVYEMLLAGKGDAVEQMRANVVRTKPFNLFERERNLMNLPIPPVTHTMF